MLAIYLPSISWLALIALTILMVVLTVGLVQVLRHNPTDQPGMIPKIIPMLGWTLNPKSPNFVPIAFYMGDILAFMASVTFLSQRL
ncbi:hypothetical protein FC83_GL003303 [Agrilactobacillus composti DSM 18527 = JCM 14202]|uniref:Uncharacterized protein n=1 Tax=Agrilactobacillus composti DSM 18527 = JCM 14202 TaxID=1423734 RepID=A0A0R1XX00_9LACO|nr:hypothetical protein FC83_GL003303 [Agrilactobacillus composti DSM 18527 = JCM 14202]